MITGAVSAAWLDQPLRRFVQDSRVQRAVVLRTDGKVLGQFGFQSSAEVKTACALAAAINASGRALGKELDGRPFLGLHQGGRSQGVFMGSCTAGGRECLLLAAFDRESTLGLVRLYFGEFRDSLGGAEPLVARSEQPQDLESDLNSSLDALFGPLT
jgi:predicted regulator of Ras-like GTPase activity (Roadblock/LC7/MglB family)